MNPKPARRPKRTRPKHQPKATDARAGKRNRPRRFKP